MSATRLPRQLKAFNLYIDGRSYAGRVESVTPPALAFQMEEHRAGGMDAPVELEVGMQLMTMPMVISDFEPELMKLIGKDDVPLALRGAVQAQGESAVSVVINARGRFSTLEFAEWTPGNKNPKNLTASLNYFRYRQDDVEFVEIDVINMVRRIGGEDQLSDQRLAIGL